MEENAAEDIPKESTDNTIKEMPDEEKKKGFFEKIKEKLAKKKQESGEPAAKKGFFEKIKEKFKKKEEEKPQQAEEDTKLDDLKEAVEEGFVEDKAQ